MHRVFLLLAALAALMAAGCAPQPPVVPEALMAQVTPGLSLEQVRTDPAQYQGKTVLWGGRIIKAVNKPKGTLVEVLQLPLDGSDRPIESDHSQGRFIVAMSGYLETFIYNGGREVTVVGDVNTMQELPVGEYKYKYVLLRGKEIKLWPKRSNVVKVYPPPPMGMWYMGPGPYWYNSPFLWW